MDTFLSTEQYNDPRRDKDAAWRHFEQRGPAFGAGPDEDFDGGLGESTLCRGLFTSIPKPTHRHSNRRRG